MALIYAGQRLTGTVLSTEYRASDIAAVTVTAASLTDLTATFSVPANDAVAANQYEIEAWANGTWGSTQQTLQLAVVFGGNTMSTLTLGSTFFSASQAFRVRVVGRVVCLTTGSTGTFSSLLFGETSAFGNNLLPQVGSQGTSAFTVCESSGTTTIDTTAAQGLKIQAAWGSTTGAPTITKRVAIQHKIGIG